MLLELIATCVIGAGVTYTPPQGWTLERVTFVGQIDACSYDKGSNYGTCLSVHHPRYTDNRVTLRRAVQVGQQVEAPKGCVLTSAVKDVPRKACIAPEPNAQGDPVFIECPPQKEP